MPPKYVKPVTTPQSRLVKILDKEPVKKCLYKGEIVGLVHRVENSVDVRNMREKYWADYIVRVKIRADQLGGNRAVRVNRYHAASRYFEVYAVYRCR